MALLSEVDWAILLIVAGFLLFGRENRALLRTLGRYYGRAMRLKQELLSELSRAADLPMPAGGRALSVRNTLLAYDPLEAQRAAVPVAVARPPVTLASQTTPSWVGAVGPETWSMALPSEGLDGRRSA